MAQFRSPNGTIDYHPRPPHEQVLDATDEESTDFTHAQFIAYLNPASIKYDRAGQLILSFTVLAQFSEKALTLRHAMNAIPLSVDIQPWKVYTEMDI